MRHKNSKNLYTYWNNLRGSRKAPDRREIEPSDIREILGDTFILEIDRDLEHISFRLAGTRLCNVYGRELKGVGFLSLWHEQDNYRMFKLVNDVFNSSTPCLIAFSGITDENEVIECEMSLFPLLNGSNHASRILGASFQVNSSSNHSHEPIVLNRMKNYKFLEKEVKAPLLPATPSLLANISHRPLNVKKIQHLTVIEGGLSTHH